MMDTRDAPALDPQGKALASDERRWRYRHPEPSTRELLADPIAHLLMRADRLTPREVYSALERARGEAQPIEL
jgi:hypothetical protein